MKKLVIVALLVLAIMGGIMFMAKTGTSHTTITSMASDSHFVSNGVLMTDYEVGR